MFEGNRISNCINASRRSHKLRRAVMTVVLASAPLLGVAALGASSASATTSEVTTNYSSGDCVGAYFGGPGSAYCLSARLTSTGVAEFKSVVIVDTLSNNCFANGGSDYTSGFYLSGSTWEMGSGGQTLIDSSNHDANYASSVLSSTSEQVVTLSCTLDFDATY